MMSAMSTMRSTDALACASFQKTNAFLRCWATMAFWIESPVTIEGFLRRTDRHSNRPRRVTRNFDHVDTVAKSSPSVTLCTSYWSRNAFVQAGVA